MIHIVKNWRPTFEIHFDIRFVVHILERFFNKNRQEATDIMLHVHRRGVGICGIFTYEVAETKVAQVMDFARANEQPLQCTMEKE